jgi:hypothetical protein
MSAVAANRARHPTLVGRQHLGRTGAPAALASTSQRLNKSCLLACPGPHGDREMKTKASVKAGSGTSAPHYPAWYPS